MRLDIPPREPPGTQGQDLLVEPLKAPLALSDDPRVKRPRPIPPPINTNLTALDDQHPRRRPVPSVARPAPRFLIRRIAEVVNQPDLHRPLHQPLRELGHKPTRASHLLLGPDPREQLVDQLIGQQRPNLLDKLTAGIPRARSASASLRSTHDLAPRHARAPILGLLAHTQPT